MEPIIFLGGLFSTSFLTIFRQTIFTPWFGFLAHGFLIMDLELGFWMSIKTLYYVVNILYNAMKETKRACEALKVGFSLRGFQGNLCVPCECHLSFYFFLKNLYVLLHLIRFKTYSIINLGNNKSNAKNTLLVENLKNNLLSVRQTCDQGHILIFDSQKSKSGKRTQEN